MLFRSIPMKKTEYRLDEQIRQAFLSLETKWTEKEIGFQVELEEVKYTGNEGLFMHIWMNLLDNAIKFSPAKGTIMMFLKQEKDSVMFILEDEGPGIEDDVKTRIFDKFYQADGSHKAEGNGQMTLPPHTAASSSRAAACSASPRPTEMQMAGRGRSTAVRKPPISTLKPTIR